MDRIHRHYVSLQRANHRNSAARHAGLRARLWFWRAWHLLPYYRGLQSAIENGARDTRKLKQLIQVPLFAARFRVDPAYYYQYGLDRQWSRRRDYMYHDEIVAVLGDLNARAGRADVGDLADKRSFFRRCLKAGLRTVPIIAEFENKAAMNVSTDHGGVERDLFSKFATRYCGEGAMLWRFSSGGYSNGELALALPKLHSHLASLSTSFPIVLQPRITNAVELRPISGNGLSTCRVITIRRPGASPEVALASYRMPVGEHVADNFAMGSIACPIALDTGVLGAGAFKSSHARDNVVRVHPDSGAAVVGRRLPHWSAAKLLALAAHQEFSSMPSVGWDIALTEEGPLLLEGNAIWCVDLAQLSHRRPLAETPIPTCLADYLDSIQARAINN